MSNFPIVNINGDNVETLLKQHNDVYRAALKLREALAQAAPHGRNYQTTGSEAAAHNARTEWLLLNEHAHEIQLWAEHTLNELMRQAHDRMSSHEVGQIAMRVLR